MPPTFVYWLQNSSRSNERVLRENQTWTRRPSLGSIKSLNLVSEILTQVITLNCITPQGIELLALLTIAHQARISLEPDHELAALHKRSSCRPSMHPHWRQIFVTLDEFVVSLLAQFQKHHNPPWIVIILGQDLAETHGIWLKWLVEHMKVAV